MIAKAGLGLVGLGAIGIGSVAFAKPEWLGINKETIWTPLSQDKDFKSKGNDYGDDKFGGKYKNYLTGITGKTEGSNDAWWQKSYEQWKKDHAADTAKTNLGNKFKETITGPVKTTDGTGPYLKEICDTIYKTDNSKVTASPGAADTDKYKEADVWKYCSPLGQKPKTIQEAETTNPYGTDKIGKIKESNLISVTGVENDKFWEIRDKEFKGLDGYDPIETESTDNFFKNKQGTTIKELCGLAYEQKPETSSSKETAPTEAQAIKYCSLDKSSN